MRKPRALRPGGIDLTSYLLSAQALSHGASPYRLPTPFPYLYPPTLAFLLIPLTAVPPFVAVSRFANLWAEPRYALPIYAGGLGVLAGDHCKEASDLGLPLVGVGFVYPQGYFQQRITSEGRQEAIYERFDYNAAPMESVINRDTQGGLLALNIDNRVIYVSVWRVRLGPVSLYLMDTDVEENEPWDRELSARLYGGDQETRIRQEMILGIGGVRMLERLGIHPAIFHANEGHAAFLMLERLRSLVQGGMIFKEAVEYVRSGELGRVAVARV